MNRQGGGIQDVSPLQLTCEHVFGITSTSNAAFVSHRQSGLLAYSAGCIIVIVDVKNDTQTRIINLAKKDIVSLAFSSDGKYIASGEGGHKPSVRVWDISSGQLFAHFDGHDNAIPFVAFSPDDKYLVSIGNQFDNTINLWNWRKRERLSSTKNTAEVHTLIFPDSDSRHFLTVGKGHAKFWYIEEEHGGRFYLKGVVPAGSIAKKVFSSAVHTDNNHVVAAYSKFVCKISVDASKRKGETNKENIKDKKDKWILRSTEKSVDAKHISSLAVDTSLGRLFVGCENGTIKVLDAKTLASLEPDCLPKPHRLDNMLGDNNTKTIIKNESEKAADDIYVYPDTVALSWLGGGLLASVYSDHSIYVWNVANLKNVTKTASWLFHSCRVLGVDVYPSVELPLLPPKGFATCGNDGTIRIWKANDKMTNGSKQDYELLHVIYCADLIELQNNKQEPDSSAVANCVVFNPNGRELAAGFRNGCVRIYDLTKIGKFITPKPAEPAPIGHSSSVMALEYSRLNVPGVQLLASGGCDGFISIFNVANGYSVQQTFKSLQSSAINGLRFAMSKSDLSQIWLISSAQDKSLRLYGSRISSVAKMDAPDYLGKFDDGRQIVLPCSPHDLEINDQQAVVAVACHDRVVRIYDIHPSVSATGNNDPLCSYVAAGTNDGTLKKFTIDPTGSLVATICSDRTISLSWRAWETKKDRSSHDRVLATSSGHSEQMLGVKFFPDSQRFVTVAGDSCIFIWKAPSTENLEQKVLMSRQSSGASDSSVQKTSSALKSSRTPSNSSRRSTNSSLSPSGRQVRPPSSLPTSPIAEVIKQPPPSPVDDAANFKTPPPELIAEPVAKVVPQQVVDITSLSLSSPPAPSKAKNQQKEKPTTPSNKQNKEQKLDRPKHVGLSASLSNPVFANTPGQHEKVADKKPAIPEQPEPEPVKPVTSPEPSAENTSEIPKEMSSSYAEIAAHNVTKVSGEVWIPGYAGLGYIVISDRATSPDEDLVLRGSEVVIEPKSPQVESPVSKPPDVEPVAEVVRTPSKEKTPPKEPVPIVEPLVKETSVKPVESPVELIVPPSKVEPLAKEEVLTEPVKTKAQVENPAPKKVEQPDADKFTTKIGVSLEPLGKVEPSVKVIKKDHEAVATKTTTEPSHSSRKLPKKATVPAADKPGDQEAVKTTAEVSLKTPVKPVQETVKTTAEVLLKPKQVEPVPVLEPETTVKTHAEVSLKPPNRVLFSQKPAKLDLIKTASPSRDTPALTPTPPGSGNPEDMANELQQLSFRLVNELHASPPQQSDDSIRRRVLQAIFQVRRELDEVLETALFNPKK